MTTRILTAVFALSLAFALAACAPAADEPAVEAPAPPLESPGTDIQPAPGLYDMEDGRVQAVGVLEWIDLEGGFWAVTDNTAAIDDEGTSIAVIANGEEMRDVIEPHEGLMVSVIGERFEGASIRMAGPEIIAETIEPLAGTPGPAE